ncbi:MAG: CHAT domain-containing protein [Prochlorotrichaceae cyanobacterium]|jgi:CHAT domain-containing protein
MNCSRFSRQCLAALQLGVSLLPWVWWSPAWGAVIRAPEVSAQLTENILNMEREQEDAYETYFGRDLAEVSQTPAEIAVTLAQLEQETGQRAAVLWVKPQEDFLHLVLITPGEEPIVRDLPEVSPSTLRAGAQIFHRELRDPFSRRYLQIGQRLHQWLIEPFEAEFLQPREIDSLLVCLWSGVRGLPLAALHDGEQFLIEKYNVTTIPAFNLVDHDYTPLERPKVLAMGASEFSQQSPLPAVPLELGNILDIFQGKRSFLNEEFTVTALEDQLQQAVRAYQPFNIVHLATHASFNPGAPDQSYIQFWDRRLRLDEISEIPWNQPPLELLVLSACETAVGNGDAELGFAGLALNAGVKSALASLWSVSDAGTLVLMSEFYQQLNQSTTKAEALRQAQLKLLRKEVQIQSDRLVLSRGTIPVPDNLQVDGQTEFSHPFFWAGFTLISSPW